MMYIGAQTHLMGVETFLQFLKLRKPVWKDATVTKGKMQRFQGGGQDEGQIELEEGKPRGTKQETIQCNS